MAKLISYLLLFYFTLSCTHLNELKDNKKNSVSVIIDSDPALGLFKMRKDGSKPPRDVDDGLAIVEAMNSKKINLLGITTVFGNCPTADLGAGVASRLVKLKDRNINVVSGADSPISRSTLIPNHTNSASVSIEAMVNKSPMKVTILALGPLTNIAQFILNNKKNRVLLGKIDKIVVVMGRSPGQIFSIGFGKERVSGVRDFNYMKDPVAAKIVLDSGIPMVFAPFELSVSVTITPEMLNLIKQRDTVVSSELYSKTQNWMKHWMAVFNDSGFHPWDSAALGWITNPEFFACDKRGYRIASARMDSDQVSRAAKMDELFLEFGVGDGFQGKYTYCSKFESDKKSDFTKNLINNLY